MTNQSVNAEPKVEMDKALLERLAMKASIMKLMDSFLRIQSHGGARTELLESSISISGKEMFAEALIDLIQSDRVSDEIKTLESLKSYITDWQTLDSRIDDLSRKNDFSILEENSDKVMKINSLIELYGSGDVFDEVLENHTSRMDDKDEAYKTSLVSMRMSENDKYRKTKNNLLKISEKFFQRAKELGYDNNN